MPGFSDEVDAVTKRTSEVMVAFSKNYLGAVISASLSDTMDGALEEVIGEMKDCALVIAKGKKEEEANPEEEKEEPEFIVGAKVNGRSKETDVDTSVYTAYNVVTCKISPNDSNLQVFKTRYRDLLKINKKVHNVLKDKFPEEVKFPAKRIFGNKEEKFLEKREHELTDWIVSLAKNAVVSHNSEFLRGIKLEEDENAEFNHGVFVDAFNGTADELGVVCSQDPDEFEDEGTGLVVLMLGIAEKEFMPKIEEKIAALPAAHGVARKSARSAVASAIGKVVRTAWEASAGPVEKAKGALNEQLSKNQDVIKDGLKKILGKLTPILVEKLAKKQPAKAPEEEKDFEPTIDQLPVGKQMIETAGKEEKVVEAFAKYQDIIKAEFKVRDRLVKEADQLIHDTPDADLRHVFVLLRDMLSGVADLWLKLIDSLLTGILVFLKARESHEEAVVKAGSAEAAKPEFDKVIHDVTEALRDFGLKLAALFHSESNDLKSKLRGLSSDASSGLRDTITGIPQSLLNALASYRLTLKKNIGTVYDKGTDPEVVRQEWRRVFVDSGLAGLNSFFGSSWATMANAVSDAARQTLVEKLSEPATPIVEEVFKEIESVVSIPGVDMQNIADTAVEKILNAIANTALSFTRKKFEKVVFTSDE